MITSTNHLRHRSTFCISFFNDPATTEIYTLSLHDALPISHRRAPPGGSDSPSRTWTGRWPPSSRSWSAIRTGTWRPSSRSEEHTSELQSLTNLVCRLLLEKKKTPYASYTT